MTRGKARKLRWALALLAIAAAGSVSFLRTERAGALVCGVLRAELPRAIGHEVSIGSCRVLPFEQAIRLTQVSVRAPGAQFALAEADAAEVSLRSVLPGRVALSHVALERPRVRLDVATLPRGGPSATGCPLDALKRLSIDHLEITNADVTIEAPAGRVTLSGVGLEWEVRRGVIAANLELMGGQATREDKTVAIGRSRIEAELDVGDERATLRRAEVQVDGATASLSGKLESLCDAPEVALTGQFFLPLSAVPRLTGQLVGAQGSVWVRAAVTGKLAAPRVRAEVQATDVVLPPARPGDLSARLVFSGKDLDVEEFHARVGLGWVKGRAHLVLDQALTLKAQVETQDASLARALEKAGIAGAWVDFPATLKGGVSGHLLPRPELSGDFEAKLGRFTLASRGFDAPPSAGMDILSFGQSKVSFRLNVLPDRVHFSGARVAAGPTLASQATADVSIYYDLAGKGLEITADASHLELSDFGKLAGLDLAGRGAASIRLTGPPARIAIDGQVALRDFVLANYAMGVVQSPLSFRGETLGFDAILGQKGKTQFSGKVGLTFKKEGLKVLADVQVPRGRTEDLIDVIAGLHPTVATFQDVLTGDVEGEGHVDSPASTLTGTIALRLKDTRYLDRGFGAGGVTLRFDRGEALVLDPTRLAGPLGVTTAQGRWNWAGPLDFKFALEGGSLAEAINPQTRGPVGGRFTVKGGVGGSTDAMVVDAWLTSPEVTFNGAGLGPAHLELRMVGRELDFFGSPFAGGRGKVHLSVREPYPLQGGLTVELKDLRPLLPAEAVKQGLGGSLAGKLTFGGSYYPLSEVTVGASLERVALSRGEFSVKNDGPVELSWHRGKVGIERLAMRGSGTEIETQGSWGPEAADLKAQGTLDLRWVEPFVTTLERVGGRMEFAASVTGSVEDPEVAGTADVQDMQFLWRGQPFAARSLSGRADFSRSRVLLSDFQGFLNDGKVRGRADVRLQKLAIAGLEANLDLEEVTYALRPDWPATLTGNILFFGKPDAYQLAGAVDLMRFRYEKPMALDALQKDVRERRYASSDVRPQEWLRFDLDISLAGDVRIDNNLARSRLGGRVKLLGTNVTPLLSGTIEALDGSQAFFRGNQLNIQRGLLTFNGSGLEPTFDLTANTQIREYLVSVKAFGRLDDPKVSYTSEPALSEADVVSLFTLGITSHDGVSSQAGAGLAAEALFTASGLNRQVQRFLNKNEVLKETRVNLSTTYNEATGQAEPSLSWESKVLSEDLKVGVTQPVTGRGTKAQAEYKFNQRVSARAQWDNQSQDSSVGNPGVDLKFRFEWE